MKSGIVSLFAAAFILLLASNSFAQKIYTVDDAKNHIGDTAIVKGEVSQLSVTKGGQVYFNMGGKYPNNKFSAVILKANVSKFDNVKDYEGKIVEIKGEIKLYNSKPEIVLEKKDQIKISEKEETKK